MNKTFETDSHNSRTCVCEFLSYICSVCRIKIQQKYSDKKAEMMLRWFVGTKVVTWQRQRQIDTS
jgi:hypothetical protein